MTPEMQAHEERVARVKLALIRAERCEHFFAEDGDPCDGLEGCDRCLRIAAEDVLETLNAAGALRRPAPVVPTPAREDPDR